MADFQLKQTAEEVQKAIDKAERFSWNELADKPFGDEVVEIVPEMEIVGVDDGTGVLQHPLDVSVFSGGEEWLEVTFDGVKYTCVGDFSGFVPAYGNKILMGGEDTGEPFCIMGGVNFGMVLLVVFDENPHTISITAPTVRKIDNKYINACPKFFLGQNDSYLYHDINETSKVTKEELVAVAFKSPIIFSLGDTYGYFPVFIAPYGGGAPYGYVDVLMHGETKTYYTAEYTGE